MRASLIPRPETEVRRGGGAAGRPRPGRAAWRSTSALAPGAIALALATEGRFDRVIATDVSADALAGGPAQRRRPSGPSVPVDFRQGADSGPAARGARPCDCLEPAVHCVRRSGGPAGQRARLGAVHGTVRGRRRHGALRRAVASGATPVSRAGRRGWCSRSTRGGRERRRRWRRSLGWVDVRLVRDLSGRDRVLVARRPASRSLQRRVPVDPLYTTHDPGPEARHHARRQGEGSRPHDRPERGIQGREALQRGAQRATARRRRCCGRWRRSGPTRRR